MASQKRFQGNSESLKALQKAIKYTTFVIFVKNERSVGRNSSELERAKKYAKLIKLQQFREGWVGERCEKRKLLGDSRMPESWQKGCELEWFREGHGSALSAAGVGSGQPKRLLKRF